MLSSSKKHPGYLRTVCRNHRSAYVQCDDVLEEEAYCSMCALEQERDGAIADRDTLESKWIQCRQLLDQAVTDVSAARAELAKLTKQSGGGRHGHELT